MECRYDLRGTDAESVCPECGAAVALSREWRGRVLTPSQERTMRIAIFASFAYFCLAAIVNELFFGLVSSAPGGAERIANGTFAYILPLGMLLVLVATRFVERWRFPLGVAITCAALVLLGAAQVAM